MDEKFTIVQLVNKLIGPVVPVADNMVEDMGRLENLRKMIKLADVLTAKIYEVSRLPQDAQHSVMLAAKEAESYLEILRELTKDIEPTKNQPKPVAPPPAENQAMLKERTMRNLSVYGIKFKKLIVPRHDRWRFSSTNSKWRFLTKINRNIFVEFSESSAAAHAYAWWITSSYILRYSGEMELCESQARRWLRLYQAAEQHEAVERGEV